MREAKDATYYIIIFIGSFGGYTISLFYCHDTILIRIYHACSFRVTTPSFIFKHKLLLSSLSLYSIIIYLLSVFPRAAAADLKVVKLGVVVARAHGSLAAAGRRLDGGERALVNGRGDRAVGVQL